MFTQGRIRVLALCVADIACVLLTWALMVYGYWALGKWLTYMGVVTSIGRYSPSLYLAFWPVPLVFIFINSSFSLYHGNWMYPAAPLSPVEEMRRLFGSSLLTHIGVIAVLAFAYQTTEGFSRVVIAFSGLLTALGAQSFRNWMRYILFKTKIGQIPVFLAGGGEVASHVTTMLGNDAYSGLNIVGYFDGVDKIRPNQKKRRKKQKNIFKRELPFLGSLRDIVSVAKKRDVKILLVCLDERLFRQQLEEFSSWFTYIEYIPSVRALPLFGSRVISIGGIGGFEMVNQGRMKIKQLQKRVLDTLLSSIAFVFLLPFFIILPFLIKMTSHGPVFFRQKRLGRNGVPIYVWKFRSMYRDADERLKKLLASDPRVSEEWARHFKLDKDPRITPLGRFLRKTSLDEIPQLFNVIFGDMALIGPRPIVEGEVTYYGNSYKIFSSVKPGVTGLWQVSGRSNTDYAQRVALDTYYVLNWSPWMDLWILVRTVYAVFLMRGAC